MRAAGRGAGLALAACLALGALGVGCAPGVPRTPEVPGTPGLPGLPGAPGAGADTLRFPQGWPLPADAPPVRARRAMVVSTDSLASAAGLSILREGGNAVDAAAAVHFALAVVNPQAGNLGGGGFLVARLADGTEAALDFREQAPGAATPDMYLDSEGRPTDASWTGYRASGVPGSVAGMEAAHRRFGSLPWARLLAPAIAYAEEGVRVSPRLHEALAGQAERLGRFPGTAAALLPGGAAPEVGTVLRQPDLARTLRAIAAGGADAFYRGWIADSLVAEMRRGGGLIDREDLASYRAVWREPMVLEYRGRRIVSMPPPSSGGVTLGIMLNILEGWDLGALGWRSPEAIHRMVETMRRAYADRNFWLGDPDFVTMPLDRLLSAAHADSLRATIDPERASESAAFGQVPRESEQTTHFSLLDPEGNAVAVTTTLNGTFGSGVAVRGAGFLLNNEMDDFTVKPGVPNAYGLVQGEANAIRPGKRMLSSMTPTIVVGAEGRTELITGTPGGGTIITTVLQMVTAHLDWEVPPQTAVNAPRFHHQHLPDVIRYERGGLGPATAAELRRRGHRLEERDGFSGDVQSIAVEPGGGRIGASDPRLGGRALGF